VLGTGLAAPAVPALLVAFPEAVAFPPAVVALLDLLLLLCAKTWCIKLMANKLANRTAAEIATVEKSVVLCFLNIKVEHLYYTYKFLSCIFDNILYLPIKGLLSASSVFGLSLLP
jgi:hypothetical protein